MNIHAPASDFDLSKLLVKEDYTFTLPDLSKMKNMDEQRPFVLDALNKLSSSISNERNSIKKTRKTQKNFSLIINQTEYASNPKLFNLVSQAIKDLEKNLGRETFINFIYSLRRFSQTVSGEKFKKDINTKIDELIKVGKLNQQEMNDFILTFKILERKTAPHTPELRTVTSSEELKKFMFEEI